MDIQSLLLNIDPSSASEIIIRILVLVAISTLLIWVLNLILQGAKNKSGQKTELVIRNRFLYSLTIFIILYSVYFGFLIWFNGIGSFNFDDATFYLGISHLIIVFLGISILFFVKYQALDKLINS